MIYVTVAENINEAIPEKYREKSESLKRLIYFFRNLFTIILEKNIENKKIYILPSMEKKYIEKLKKIIKIKCINNIVLSEKLRNDEEFLKDIKKENVKILDGRWIYKYLEEAIIDYIVKLKNEKNYIQEITIMTNEFDEIDIENIKNIAKKVKILNIVTKKQCLIKKIEKNIFEEDGIIINVNNNYKKSLLKSDIIINENFNIEEFENYELPKKACILNIEKKFNINSKTFEGVNVLSVEISVPKRFINLINEFKDFNTLILYESYIYKRTSVKNIKNEIEKDEIKILNIYGQSGKIRKNEFKMLSRNLK